MSLIREPIYSALWNKVRGVAGFKTASRRLKHWADVPKTEQPALFMVQMGESANVQRGVPLHWKLEVHLYVYINADADPYASPAPALNAVLDAIEAALEPSIGDFQTLGGLVYNCWINGKIETLEGVLGGQEVAIIPIEIDVIA